ncbi:uncharacterized protein K02A2.6-like [Xyrichtys novacula]|uniref:Uncharacterized protein K02A2.6-like n=1 Tax=Xyrichtys novacula TaxID=13765 RepID=A0AAV1FZ63_XYRNO|nr:uncharacterized protein K02A2.6-like [Xyrichtys novacula]
MALIGNMSEYREVYTTSDGKDGYVVDMDIEGQNIQMQLDTGACVSLVSEITYKTSLAYLPLSPCKIPLSTFSGERIPVLGKVDVNVEYEQQAAKVPLVIVRGDRPALLGRNWLKKFKLNWKEIFQVKVVGEAIDPEVAAILQRHKGVFEEGPSTIRVSPAELFLKRQVRTRFSLLKPCLAGTVEEKQQSQKKYHDKGRTKLRELSAGDQVSVGNFREGKEKWMRGTVVKRLGPVSYLVNDGVRERTVHIDHLLLLHEKAVDDNSSSDDAYRTPDLDSLHPRSSIQEAEWRIATPAPSHSLVKPATLPERLSPASCTHSSAQYSSTPVKPAEPVAVSVTTQQTERRYPERLRAPPKRLTF